MLNSKARWIEAPMVQYQRGVQLQPSPWRGWRVVVGVLVSVAGGALAAWLMG